MRKLISIAIGVLVAGMAAGSTNYPTPAYITLTVSNSVPYTLVGPTNLTVAVLRTQWGLAGTGDVAAVQAQVTSNDVELAILNTGALHRTGITLAGNTTSSWNAATGILTIYGDGGGVSTNDLDAYVLKSGDTMAGTLDMGGFGIQGIGTNAGTLYSDTGADVALSVGTLTQSSLRLTDDSAVLQAGNNDMVTCYNNRIDANGMPLSNLAANAYSATGWDGSTKAATENAVRDKIETLASDTYPAGGTLLGTLAVSDYVWLPPFTRTVTIANLKVQLAAGSGYGQVVLKHYTNAWASFTAINPALTLATTATADNTWLQSTISNGYQLGFGVTNVTAGTSLWWSVEVTE